MASQRSVEFKVGLFVVVCLAVIAGLIIRFGQWRPGQKAGYEISVMFPNAAGLIKDSGVMYAGIRVGKVSGIELSGEQDYPVRVRLLIRPDKQIAKDSRFVINSAGLLGDRFVDVSPGGAAEYLQPGDSVTGQTSVDVNEAVNKVKAALDQAGVTIGKLDHALQQLNNTVLSTQSLTHAGNILAHVDTASSNVVVLVEDLKTVVDENSAQLSATLKEFHNTSVNLHSASKRADALVARGDQLIATNEAEIQAAIKNLADASARLDAILAAAQQGTGTVGRLLVDPALYEEVLQLVQNWRRRGIFAKDRSERPAQRQKAVPPTSNFGPARP